MNYIDDFAEDATVTFDINMRDHIGASQNPTVNGTLAVYKNMDAASRITAGVTYSAAPFNGLAGIGKGVVDMSADAAYVTGADFFAILEGVTIDGQVVNVCVAHWSCENRSTAAIATTIGAAGAGLTEAGGTGDHLTAVPWNPGWDAEVQSEVNDGLVAYDAATGADISALNDPTAAAISDAVWDEVLTGATHNVVNSAGRRLRALGDFGLYEGGYVWIDTVNGTAGTTDFENGTVNNPVDTIADALTIRSSVGLPGFHVLPGSAVTLAASLANLEMTGHGYTLALGGQATGGAKITGATVSGTFTGNPLFVDCVIGNITGPGATFINCRFGGTITNNGTDAWYIHNGRGEIAGASASLTFDFGAAALNTALSVRNWSGGIQFENMGAAGTDTATLEGVGKFTEGTCTSGSPELRGSWATAGITNLTPVETANSPSLISALNDLSAAQVNAEVVDALATDTYAEPGQGAPAATTTLAVKLNYLYKWARNKSDNDGTTIQHYADDGTTVDQKRSVSKVASTVTRDEMATGP